MKQVEFKMPLRMLAALCFLLLSASAIAQQIAVNGHVKDATGEQRAMARQLTSTVTLRLTVIKATNCK